MNIRLVFRVGLIAGAALAGCGPQALVEAPLGASVPTAVADVRPFSTIVPTHAPTTTVRPTLEPTLEPTLAPSPTLAPPTSQPTAYPTVATTPTTEPLTAQERRQVFDEVWGIVNEHYLYPDFHGLDWQAVYEEYEPRIEAAQNDDEFYAEIAEMVARLDDNHSRFLPPAAVETENTMTSGQETAVGIGVLTLPEQDGGFIRTVFPDSPAGRAGVKPRDRIIGVDGRPYRMDDGDIQGPAGSTVRLSIARPGDEPYDVVLVRQEVQGRVSPQPRRFPGDIGYVAIPTLWVSDMDEQVSGALTELVAEGELNGLIIDLRGNGGGWGHVLSGILGHFVRGPVGKFLDQRNARVLNVTAPAGPDVRPVPLMVLVDHNTASYAEVLAAILQYEAKAQIIGTPSAGNTESIYAYYLRDGSRLWLAQESFLLQSGVNLEGDGVQPDVLLDVDWKRYSEEDDPQILEALRLLGAGPK